MKSIKGVMTNLETMEAESVDIYIDTQKMPTGARRVQVISIGSDSTNVLFTMRAYDLREAIRGR